MRILYPIGTFYPAQFGGPDNSVFNLAKAIYNEGHQSYVITTRKGLKAYDFPQNMFYNQHGVYVLYNNESIVPSIPNKTKHFIKICNPDIVHLTAIFTPLSLYSAALANYYRIPIVWSPRGELLHYTFNSKRLKKWIYLKNPLFRKLIAKSNFHFTSSEEKKETIEILRNVLKIDISLNQNYEIPNVIDKIGPVKIKPQKYKFDYILFLSRIAPKKNIETLINAFSLAKIPSSYKLVIAGWTGEDIDYSGKLKKLVHDLNLGDRVIFTDVRIEGCEKIEIYSNAKLFVLPSYSENFGMVVLEALSYGICVIASKKTPWETLETKKCGFWVEPDIENLTLALNEYFSLPSEVLESMSENAIRLSEEFLGQQLVNQYVEMYTNILKYK